MAVAFLAQVVAIGFSIATYPLFVTSVSAEFETSQMTFTLGGAILTIGMAAAGLLIGPILDRGSIRAVMVSGAILMAVGFTAMSYATEVWHLGLLLGLLIAPAISMLGPLAATTVVAKWFEELRGRAVGISSTGTIAGGLLIAVPAGHLLETLGWRRTLLWFAAGTLSIVPVIWGVIRNRPSDLGQVVDGGSIAPLNVQPGSMVAWSPVAILRSPLFWPLALALGLVFGFMGGWNYNMGKFTSDLGYDVERTSYLLGAGAIFGIPGTFLLGWLADRYDGRGLLWIALGMQVAAFAVMRTRPGFPLLIATSAVIGCTAGGLLPVYAALLGRSLGPAAFGIAMGIGGIVQLPFMAAAPPLLGRMRDTSGNFDSALLLLIAVYLVAGALLALLPSAGVPSTRPRLSGPD